MGKKDKVPKQKKKPLTKREHKFVAGIVACLVAVAAVVAVYVLSLPPLSAGAKINDDYLTEEKISRYINQYRISNGISDDTDFAKYLLDNNQSLSSFRATCINQLALNLLMYKRAEELGVLPSDEEVQDTIQDAQNNLAFGSSDIWSDTLESHGMSEEEYAEQIRLNLARNDVFEADVAFRDATDEETLVYAKTQEGITLKHSYRIVFDDDADGEKQAQKCYKRLLTTGNELNADVFSGFALTYSVDENVESDGGAYGWSDASDIPEEYAEVLSELSGGQYSEPVNIEDMGIVIIYCDESYTFPDKDKIDKLKLSDLSEQMREYMADCASDTIWNNDCNLYMTNLVAKAKITYYPIPDNADYVVDMALAYTADDDSAQASSATDAETGTGTGASE